MEIRYGLNFGCPDIPEHWRKRFTGKKYMVTADARCTPRQPRLQTEKTSLRATLMGLCFTKAMSEQMVTQVDNELRYVWVVHRNGAFAIYVW
jgi:hypothetical protein